MVSLVPEPKDKEQSCYNCGKPLADIEWVTVAIHPFKGRLLFCRPECSIEYVKALGASE